MVWFRVDDTWLDHPKMIGASDAEVALWVRAGSWSSRQLTDGVIPASMLRQFTDSAHPRKVAERLVRRGMWEVYESAASLSGVRDGSSASHLPVNYVFHDWKDQNPLREQVLRRREAAAKRQRAWQERHRAEDNAVSDDVSGESSTAGDNAVSNAVSNSPPTRPDPTRRVGGRGSSELTEEPRPAPRSQPSGRGRAAAARDQPPADPECPVCRGPHPLKDCAIQEGSDAGRSRPQLGRPPDSVAKEGAEGARELMRGTMAGRPLTASPQPGHWRDPQATARAQAAEARQLRGETPAPGGGDDGLPDEIPF